MGRGKMQGCKRVEVATGKTEYFRSMNDAQRYCMIGSYTIDKYINRDITYRGYKWYTLSDQESKEKQFFVDVSKEIRRTKKEVARIMRGRKLVLLDYETGDYVDEYSSIAELADDMQVSPTKVADRLRQAFVCMMPSRAISVMYKDTYDKMQQKKQ